MEQNDVEFSNGIRMPKDEYELYVELGRIAEEKPLLVKKVSQAHLESQFHRILAKARMGEDVNGDVLDFALRYETLVSIYNAQNLLRTLMPQGIVNK